MHKDVVRYIKDDERAPLIKTCGHPPYAIVVIAVRSRIDRSDDACSRLRKEHSAQLVEPKRHRVDLIVVFCAWESKQFAHEVVYPFMSAIFGGRQVNVSRLPDRHA